MARRRLSLKSFMFKIQKSQMQLCTHEVVQRNKIQGERKKNRGRIRVLHTTRAHPSRCSVVRESNTTDPKILHGGQLTISGWVPI